MPPIIDVHEHIFRAIDIPLKGYLLSRRYDDAFINAFGWIIFPLMARCVRKKRQGRKRGFLCRQLLSLAYREMGQGYRRWADILSRGELREMASLMLNTFSADGIDLYVPLVIDYEYWFRNSVDTPVYEQVTQIRDEVVIPFRGKIHPFVPFDPVREIAFRRGLRPPDRRAVPRSSLQLVKDAVREWGYIGVKIYNSLGYAPLGNAQLDRERRRIFRRACRGRYATISGDEIDDVLREFYAYCVEEQVPITAHCGSEGIEAYPGASFDFCRPDQWRPVLDEYPDLHLNLAHFGWSEKQRYNASTPERPQRSNQPLPTWVTVAVDMLGEYDNLYVDVAHHEVVKDELRPTFVDDYKSICHDHPRLVQPRLLFGIDWHVITRMPGFQRFMNDYVDLLGETGCFTPKDVEGFLGGNALSFLGLLPLGAPSGWNKNRRRLDAFYRANGIEPPAWFTSSA